MDTGEEREGVTTVDDPPQAQAAPDAGRPVRVRWRRPLLVLAALVVLVGCGTLLYEGFRLRAAPAVTNRALTDAAATDAVAGEVGDALAKVFSYGPDSTEATGGTARDLLAGPAADQYRALFAQVAPRVTEQRLTLTTHVVRTGVIRLTGDRADLLAFLDQRAQRQGKAATTAAAQLSVTARRVGGHWRITDLRAR
ncbi:MULTISPECIES: nuclear transport factor 2 family protein [Streptomycetaceae]|uniref:Mce-associated membrane protein n=1 Tax=Streptantibioticus cattleyicolor (strain ATCC 35852 / DSM 46488 / JCM 4925 / NBRC 14057 / NRRL 8057) TaxID=1003195 RepID=F8JUH6_STREN|nr:nuclear transport factor 2 family protein [Streptantibioticus cattleyicolor]AEW95598.1 hypothetical protein SCATT_32270 [Streptantibioticus cattleyicolor NRRL 8057 = DSM 46488]MYS60148.1 hypothetical protein [Streptomyces sp. SID5468]CCB75935.1 conserved protein of unknown function [Streptantibioticus cattleyicolor NRRL 8057 = DSM 46488]